jgi:hypothetical protein
MVQIYLPRASSAAMAGRGPHHWWKSPKIACLNWAIAVVAATIPLPSHSATRRLKRRDPQS